MLTIQTRSNQRLILTDRRLKTTFLHLPPELRNRIYILSGCLKILVCEQCEKSCSSDLRTMGLERSCSGSARIGGPVRWPRHWVCRFSGEGRKGTVDLARYSRDKKIVHEFMDQETGRLALKQPKQLMVAPTQPALTRVCRVIRSETLPIFYGTNTFIFTPKVTTSTGIGSISSGDVAWLTAIGRQNAGLVRCVEVRWLGWCRRALLENFKGQLRGLGMRVGDEGFEVEVSCWTNEERWSSGFEGERLMYIAP